MHPKGDFFLLGNKTLIIKDKIILKRGVDNDIINPLKLIIKDKIILKRGVDNDIINPLKNNKVNKQF
jgi:hypothetical protein